MKTVDEIRGNSVAFAEKRISPSKVLGEHNPRVQSKGLTDLFQFPSRKPEQLIYDSETTKKLTNENSIYCSYQSSSSLSTPVIPPTSNTILKVKQLVAEILDESGQARQEMRILKERFEYTMSSKDSQEPTKRELVEFDLSSIKSSIKEENDISDRICDLKTQLQIMNRRIHLGEKNIMQRSEENTELKFIIYKLHQQIETIKQKQLDDRVNKSICRLSCSLF